MKRRSLFSKLNLLITCALLSLSAQSVLAEDPFQHQHHHPELKGDKPSTKSLYWLEGKWNNQLNQKLELKSFKGQNVVIAMIYTSCKSVCPLIVNDVKIIEKSLKTNELKDTEFVLVSFDPKHDTPQVLADYAKKQNLAPDRWQLLHGSAEQVAELAAMLGVRYQENAQGEFIHSNQISLLNRNGELVYQRPDLKTSLELFLEKYRASSQEHHHH